MLIDSVQKNRFYYEIYLCKSSYPFDIIGCLTNSSTNRIFKWQLRNVDEMSLRINKTFEDGSLNTLFDTVEKTNVIKVEKWIDNTLDETFLFSISDIDIISDISEYKDVRAYSLEVRMNNQILRDYQYTVPIYTGTWDSQTIEDHGIVDCILSLFKGIWTVGYVTPNLLNSVRVFDIPSLRVLEVIKVIENNFNCIFLYHTNLQIIDIVEHGDPLYALGLNANTGLILDHNNYVEQYRSQMNLDDIITRLYVTGIDGADIKDVNILGTGYIDDFTFFMNTRYMTQGLIDALNALEILRDSQQTNFDNLVASLDALRLEVTQLDFEIYGLDGLYEDLLVLEDNQDMAIKNGGTELGQTYSYWKIQGDSKQAEIDAKLAQISVKNGEINVIIASLDALHTLISYETNLTENQLKELVNFIKEEEQDFDSDEPSVLIDLARNYLDLNSQSSYDINVDIIDVFGSKADSYVWNKIKLGHKVNLLIPYE